MIATGERWSHDDSLRPALEDHLGAGAILSGTGDTGYIAGTKDQLKSIRKPGGDCSATVAAGRKLCTSYTYDGAGRVTSVTNGNANTTTYAYDKMDRTTGAFFGGATSCDLGSSNCRIYTYDAEGNLITRTEGFLESSTFDYDQMNRQVGQNLPVGALQAADQLSMAFDGVGNLTAYAQLVNNTSDVAYYYYDSANRLNGVSDATAVAGVGIGLTSDNDGRTKSITFPKPAGTDGMKVDYDYTKNGKPKALDIEKHSGTSLAAFDYDYTKSIYGGTFQVETGQMQNRTVTGSLSNLNSDVDYTYNTDKRLTGANAASGTDYTFEYDNVGNLTKEQGTSTTYYGYDRAGELCWKGTNTGTKLDRACPTTPAGNTTIGHDPAGNSTNTTADPITYNNHDQVTAIGGVSMGYRDLGNDLRKTSGGARMVHGPMGITATVSGSTVTFYTRDPQGNILNAHNTTGTQNYVTEYNGSVAALYNPSGAAVGSYKYTPYGTTTVAAETGGTTAAANPFRYISGYQDKTSSGADGYYKLGARYYDSHGHFTQPDPIVSGGGSYHYGFGDPINHSDPSGLYPGEDFIEGAGDAIADFIDSGFPKLIGLLAECAYAANLVGTRAAQIGAIAGPNVAVGAGAIGAVGACTTAIVYSAKFGYNPISDGLGGEGL